MKVYYVNDSLHKCAYHTEKKKDHGTSYRQENQEHASSPNLIQAFKILLGITYKQWITNQLVISPKKKNKNTKEIHNSLHHVQDNNKKISKILKTVFL